MTTVNAKVLNPKILLALILVVPFPRIAHIMFHAVCDGAAPSCLRVVGRARWGGVQQQCSRDRVDVQCPLQACDMYDAHSLCMGRICLALGCAGATHVNRYVHRQFSRDKGHVPIRKRCWGLLSLTGTTAKVGLGQTEAPRSSRKLFQNDSRELPPSMNEVSCTERPCGSGA
jgi:hypothetical protein